MTPEQRRLMAAARKAEDAHLNRAKSAVVRQLKGVTLTRAEQALKAALSVPASKREASIRAVLTSISEATQGTRTPPAAVLGVMRRAVADRVLNAQDLALLTDPKLLFGDSTELQAKAVARQRKEMNGYWKGETIRFRNDVAASVREAIRGGLDPEKAADLLQERLGVHRSRAVLIAVDQVLTATARAEQSQLRAAGLKAFQWRTVGDNRVRSAHARLEGRVFTWRGAPELPGAAIRCRCRAVVPSSDLKPEDSPALITGGGDGRDTPDARRESLDQAVAIARAAGMKVVEDAGIFERYAALEQDQALRQATLDAPALFLPRDTTIYLNPAASYWADPASVAKRRYSSELWSSDHPQHAVHHEMGHASLFAASERRYFQAQKGKFSAGLVSRLRGKVSSYALESPLEFVAEVYAGLKGGKVYDQEVMGVFNLYGGQQP